MNEIQRLIASHLTFHSLTNLLVALLYFLVFISVVKMMASDQKGPNRIAISIAMTLLLLAAIFIYHAVIMEPWKQPFLEFVFLAIAYIPGLLFITSRKEIFVIGSENAMAAKARFDKLKDDFLTVASHELRTPMSVINGFAEILVREKLGPLNDEQKRRVRKILMQGQRLHRIIDELLDLSRIRSGRIQVKKEVFDLVPVLKASLDDHQIVCEQQKIELADEIPDVLPDVVGDLERVTHVIVNLLNNAIKYTPAGGTVTLKACHDRAKNAVRIEVYDTGIGISPQEQNRVFDEFYRANQEHTKKYSGSGLGLAIVKQLVESQGGEVGLVSEGIGKGCMFYFTLPVSEKPAVSVKAINS
jgi:signal transduction histidine kinase